MPDLRRSTLPSATGSHAGAREIHARAKEIFYRAARIPARARAGLIARASAGSPGLRRELESLLSFHGKGATAFPPLPAARPLDVEHRPLAPGGLFARRYRIELPLGAGGMGRVYRARDELLQVMVAVKVLRFRAVVLGQRLFEEVRLARLVSHPVLRRVYDVGVTAGQCFITMEYVEGEDLAACIARDGPLPAARVIELGSEILAGLSAAHGAGVLHRDLKPANILIDRSGAVHISDFGFAPTHGSGPGTTQPAGSPAYMAPEQFVREGVVSERTDLYAFGLVLYEALTGRRPFVASAMDRLRALQRTTRPQPPSRLVRGIDPALETLILECLEKDPLKRPGSAAEISARLGSGKGDPTRLPTAATIPAAPEGAGTSLAELTSFVGHAAEIADISQRLREGSVVTLVGAPGAGKTRLALAVARAVRSEHAGGTWFADLSGLERGEQVAGAVCRQLDVTRQAAETAEQALVGRLRGRSCLLILDNCEPVLAASAAIAATLARECSELRILATSREPLAIPGELLVKVEPLTLPPAHGGGSLAVLGSYESVRLLVERGAAAAPGFAFNPSNARALTRICRKLDGLPLALELAAARLRLLSIEQIAERLDDPFPLLASHGTEVAPRQRSLRALIGGSYQRLSRLEQALFRRLGVFAGRFDIEAVEAVVSGRGLRRSRVVDLFGRLVDCSLVQVERPAHRTRYRLLETLRAYALERLDAAGETSWLQSRHLDHFLAVAASGGADLMGPRGAEGLDRLDADLDNFQAALRFATTDPGLAVRGLHLMVSLHPFWQARLQLDETAGMLERLLARAGNRARSELRAEAQYLLGLLCLQRDPPASQRRFDQQLTSAKRLGSDRLRGRALRGLGLVARIQGRPADARKLLEQALALAQGAQDRETIADSLNALGGSAFALGDLAVAGRFFRRALAAGRDIAGPKFEPTVLGNLGVVELNSGRIEKAIGLFEEAVRRCRLLKDRLGELRAASNLVGARWYRGDRESVRGDAARNLDLARELGEIEAIMKALFNLAYICFAMGELAVAHTHVFEGLALAYVKRDISWLIAYIEVIAQIASGIDRCELAATLWAAVACERIRLGLPLPRRQWSERRRLRARCRARLSARRYRESMARGEALGLEGAVALARSDLETDPAVPRALERHSRPPGR